MELGLRTLFRRYLLGNFAVDNIVAYCCAVPMHRVPTAAHKHFLQLCTYLLGLLAMIKCSICSYQCDN